jgi:hypothetical protein
MIDPNCTQSGFHPNFSQNAQSFIKARSIDDRLSFYFGIIFLVSCTLRHPIFSFEWPHRGAFGFLTFSQCRRPADAVRRPTRLDTMPSQPHTRAGYDRATVFERLVHDNAWLKAAK